MKITKQQIEKYLQGKCSQEEKQKIESLLASNPNLLDRWLPEKEWNEIPNQEEYRAEQNILANIKKHKDKVHFRRILMIWGTTTAAALILLFNIYILMPPLQTIKPTESLKPTASSKKTANPNLYYINSGNENMIVKTSDGSTITVYPKSEVRFAEDFTGLDERKITMKGKVTFEVVKNPQKPFKVYSADITTIALGTIFTVNEIKAQETDIQLHEGSIEIDVMNQNLTKKIKRIIKPKESILLNHKLGHILKEVKAPTSTNDRLGLFHHTPKQIIIKNLSVIDIIKNLEQNYNIQLKFDKEHLNNKFFSGTFKSSFTTYTAIINEINYLHNTKIELK